MNPRLLEPRDFTQLAEHFTRQNEISDSLGLRLYSPFRPISRETLTRVPTLWAKPVTEPHWQRMWGICSVEDGPIIAYLSLTGPDLAVELHRARIALGVEPAFQRRGSGEALLRAAITFAREAGLAWIDLWVFAHNAPARALYHKLGFIEIGRHRDQFRIDGVSIDDIAMALALDPQASSDARAR